MNVGSKSCVGHVASCIELRYTLFWVAIFVTFDMAHLPIIHDLCLSHIITHDFCLRLSKIINPTDKIKNDTGKEYFEKTIKGLKVPK